MIMIILLILDLNYPFSGVVNMVVIYIALILTVVSLIDYIVKNYKIFIEGSNN